MENGSSTNLEGSDALRRAQTLPQASPGAGGHRRSLSGGLLSRLSFLRSSSDEASRPSQDGLEPLHHTPVQRDATPVRQQQKPRKRKGSLRKTALLGTSKSRMERRMSDLDAINHDEHIQRSPPSRNGGEYSQPSDSSQIDSEISSGRRFSYEDDATSPTDGWTLPPPSHSTLKLNTITAGITTQQKHSPESTFTSPTSRYTSTTDDDDSSALHINITSAADLTRRRSTRSAVVIPSPSRPAHTEHSYSATEWWGWTILLCTWIVFVVGMGSCLGVWSWAWDVGETPYAPPELEDDPTLPIVGYYPALIVCTGVMAWVWVVVAWVGMKYFRHARFEIGDGEE